MKNKLWEKTPEHKEEDILQYVIPVRRKTFFLCSKRNYEIEKTGNKKSAVKLTVRPI